jgi:hypothetical protein
MQFKSVKVLIYTALAFPISTHMPCAAQEREWLLDTTGEDAFLVFGVPSTTDMGISFWCKLGGKHISVFAPVPHQEKPQQTKVSLEIKTDIFPLAVKFNTDQSGATLEAKLTPQDKIIADFSTTERFTLRVGSHVSVFPTEGAGFADLGKLCNTPPADLNN